ncbi:MAG: sugar ABC transporter ATP-binding protein [Caldilineales bacterium]|nr:sugar ABC transporter ATP-binding protein [Caldilineales bacterium]
MDAVTPIITFEGISKRFGGVQALDQVSFSVPPGEIHALVGENGAGKSTLIRICGGVYGPDAGRMFFRGEEVEFNSVQESRDAGISIVHQEIPIAPHLTAAENIFLGRPLPQKNKLIDWKEVNRLTQALFDRLQVKIKPTAVAGKLTIAQQQIVVIAQALSLDSNLLIMDEPTSALNKDETEHLFEILRQLRSEGLTILYVSHRLEEVFEIADSISALRDGRYINTVSKKGATPEQIVNMMVGREVSNLFPKDYHQPSPEPLLSVRNLTVPKLAEGVSFDLYGGEVLGLVGLQGSGTSDVLRALFGVYPNSTGDIWLNGQPVKIRSSLDAIKLGIAYVPADRQIEGLFQPMSVRDNGGLLLLRQLAGRFGWISLGGLDKAMRQKVREFGIRTSSVNALISSLSGGNQQKVVIARTLSLSPTVVLLDDPTRGIDVGAKAEVHQILNQLTGQGCGVILVSSELPEVLAMSDRVITMYRGRVRATLEHDEADHELIMGLATGADAAVSGGAQLVVA